VAPAQDPAPGDRPTVGVIGLGAIGDGVAKSVHAAGLPLVVSDIVSEATDRHAEHATVAGSPADLARAADVVVVAVVNDEQVHAVLSGPDGALAAGGPDTTFVVVSTITSECVRAIGAEAEAAGTAIIDCGVSGGPSAASAGELICMVGGDEEVLVRMGPFGTGLAAKLARNLVQYGGWLAAYEGQVLAEAAGIELSKLAQVIRASDAKIGGAATLMFRSTVAPFTESDDAGLIGAMRSGADLAHKDLQAALALAAELDVDLPLAVMTEAHTDDIFGVGGMKGDR
jgi:3-hydroxyisobutyrate dehydrogenase-like beta-hydroxyacid dehydrogenase